jgi:hypothetical protein
MKLPIENLTKIMFLAFNLIKGKLHECRRTNESSTGTDRPIWPA